MNNIKARFLIHFLLVFAFASSALYAQDTTLVNLKNALDTVSTNTRKVDIWLRIADYTSEYSIDEAKIYMDSAEKLAIEENYELGFAYLNKVRGSVLALEGDYAAALTNLSDAQTKFRKLNDSLQMAKTYLLLGNVYSSTRNYKESLRYYVSSANYFDDLNDSKALAAINNNIGIVYSEIGELDSASIYYNKSLLTYLEFNDKESLSTIYTNIGVVYAENDELEKAIEYYQKSNAIYQELDRTYGQSINYLNIGDAYIYLKDYKKADENLKIAIAIAEKDGFKSLLADEYYTVGEIREAEGNYKDALKWYRKSEVMEDSLFNSETNAALIDTQTKQLEEIQKSELEIIHQINEANLEAEKLKNTLLIVVSGSILILLLIATVYFYKRARVSRKITKQNLQILNQKSKIYEQAKSIAEKNETLLEKNSKLEDINEEKNYIMNVVAHDLKSPLNQIQGLAEVIRLEQGNLSVTQLECLSNISVASDRLSNMINRVLNTRAIDSESSNYTAQEVDLSPLLDETISNFQPLADRKNIKFLTEKPFESAKVKGDTHFIRQVLENIISNSIKFSPIDKSVEIALDINDNKSVISFKDHGPGLTEEDHKILFVEYANLSAKPTGNESSTGLGLSIVKKYVDLMEGDIWCESTYGQGATFFLAFNLA
jgi:signal transduction histidine kinase